MISIIIPVYNAEKYLERCIKSVLNSTYGNFEVLLINDGSSDRSLEICRNYSDRDSRIRVFTQENQGASAARNRGIEESLGEWIVFVDSDDVIACDFLAVVADKACQNTDMIVFDHCRSGRVFKRNSCNRVRTLVPQINYYDTEDRLLIIKKMLCARDLTDSTNTSLLSPCGKAYKRSVIMKYSIRFPVDVIICEDRLFNIEYYMRARTYVHVFRTVYYVTWRADSLTHCCQKDLVNNYHVFRRKLKKFMEEQEIFETLKSAYYDNVLADMTEILIYGIFRPDSMRTYRESKRICQSVHEDEIVRAALQNNAKEGNPARRILLFFFERKHYGIVNLICKLSFLVLRRLKR